MSIRFTVFWIMLAVGIQLAPAAPKYDTGSLAGISLEEARRELASLDSSLKVRDFCDAVILTERMDLIDLCNQTRGATHYISFAIREMPDSPFKNKLILMLLRNPHPDWPPPAPVVPQAEAYTNEMERRGAAHLILPTVQKYLPDTPVDFSAIATPERRLKLADAFEAAVARVTTASSPSATRERTNPSHADGAPQSLPGSDPSATRRAADHEAGPAFGGAYAGLWVSGVLLLVAAAVWCYKCRSGRRTSNQH